MKLTHVEQHHPHDMPVVSLEGFSGSIRNKPRWKHPKHGNPGTLAHLYLRSCVISTKQAKRIMMSSWIAVPYLVV
jgi:hypothetical protein